MSESGKGKEKVVEAPVTNTTNTSESRAVSTTKSKSKGGRPKSDVWTHFFKFTTPEGDDKAKCNYCGSEYFAHSKRNGTSSLKSHLTTCRKLPSSGDLKQTQLTLQSIGEGQDENEGIGNLSTWKFDQDLCRKKLNEMIVKDELPFRIVDGEGFKEFVWTLQPRFILTSRWTISRDIYQLFLKEKERLRDFFIETGQSVCLTTDTWTSLQKLNYMCITAHFIDKDWKLNKRIINFCTIETHKGEEIGMQIDNCLREWGIARIFSVTVDNASSNSNVLKLLKGRLTTRGCSLLKGKYLHMRCVAHIVALVVGDGLKEVGTSVQRIRDAVRFVRHSPARLVKFRECCKEEQIESKSLLCLDVPTRWNSTYLMLRVACKFERAFELYRHKDPFYKLHLEDIKDGGVPSTSDWDNARRMTELLVAFYDLTVRISGSLYVTCNEFLHEITSVSDKLREWVASDDEDVSAMGRNMRAKFDKYWGDPLNMNFIIFLSVVVDPRYKLEFLEFVLIEEWGEDVGKLMSKTILDSLHELYDAHKLQIQPSSATTTTQSQIPLSKESTSMGGRNRVLAEKFKKQKVQVGVVSSINEIDVYCKEANLELETDESFDILLWWKHNQHRFPILSHVARDLLSVPISTVASESAFSTGGRVLDPFRSSLTPKIVESLICTQDWLRRSKEQISVEEDLDALIKHEEGLKGLKISDASEVIQSEVINSTPMET